MNIMAELATDMREGSLEWIWEHQNQICLMQLFGKEGIQCSVEEVFYMIIYIEGSRNWC